MRAARHAMLTLAFGFSFPDLYERDALARLDAAFLDFVGEADGGLRAQLDAARRDPAALAAKEESELLLALAPHLEDFHRPALRHRAGSRRARGAPPRARAALRGQAPVRAAQGDAQVQGGGGRAHSTARRSSASSSARSASRSASSPSRGTSPTGRRTRPRTRRSSTRRCATRRGRRTPPAGSKRHRGGVLFKAPHKLDPQRLVPVVTDEARGYAELPAGRRAAAAARGLQADRCRAPTSPARSTRRNYCIWCHEQGKDSCSKGLQEKGATGRGRGVVQEEPVRRDARRLPARGEDLRVPEGEERRPRDRRARHHRGGQPDGARRPGIASATTA